MAIRNYTTRYRRQRNMCLWCLFMLSSLPPPIVGGLRGLTMYRTRVTYTSWEYVSWGMLLHRIVVQTLPQLLNSSRQRLIKGTCLDDDTFSFAIKKKIVSYKFNDTNVTSWNWTNYPWIISLTKSAIESKIFSSYPLLSNKYFSYRFL